MLILSSGVAAHIPSLTRSLLRQCVCLHRRRRIYFSTDVEGRVLNIGGIRKSLKKPLNPELVPVNVDLVNHQSVLKVLKWMLQKDLLGQDMFLIGPPGPFRRLVCMKYLQLTQREVEYVPLSRDTTESDLKQRREIRSGTAHYVDQAAVRAAVMGRVLVLEGIEKAERNVLPVLNNLMENREMQLEDGRFLLNPTRYDTLLQENSRADLERWRLVRVSPYFRVVALGLPVPRYIGNPLDPPLRSRFQAYDLHSSVVSFQDTVSALQTAAPDVAAKSISDLVSFALTVNAPETAQLQLPDFPIGLLPALARAMNCLPDLPAADAASQAYPYQLLMPEESRRPVRDALASLDLLPADSCSSSAAFRVADADAVTAGSRPYTVRVPLVVNGAAASLEVLAGASASQQSTCVLTGYHHQLLTQLLTSHVADADMCVVGPRGCGKSSLVRHMAALLGYDVEPVVMYQDMTSRDLLQQRTTSANGDTVWTLAPLVRAALHGKMAVLDGIHRVHAGTLNVLHRLVHDRELQLYDGTRLMRHDRYDQLMAETDLTVDQLTERGVLRIHPSFRIVALAEPPVLGGSKGQWLTPELMSLFLYHSMRPMTLNEETQLITSVCGDLDARMTEVLRLSHALRSSADPSLQSLAACLSTRQLLRIGRRMQRYDHETPHQAVYKACMVRFLPPLARQALDGFLERMQVVAPDALEDVSRACHVCDGILTIGNTSTPVFNAQVKAKIPDTLFYDNDQHVAVLEAILEDFTLGENILLVGNQGVGKNKLIDRFLYLLNRPREYLQLHRDTTVQMLTLQPTVRDGRIAFEDSALVRAVKHGHVLLVDEADKAPTHVTCILKTLTEDGEMILSDGRRLQRAPSSDPGVISIHPDFQMIVLANRPGFPFLGNDFFAALGDLFSCHSVDNPSRDSERMLLKHYGPDVPDDIVEKVVSSFSELRQMADQGTIAYPYSTREAVNIIKHLQMYPGDGLASVVGNVFDFDSYSPETRESLLQVLHRHGVPVGARATDIQLAKQYRLPSAVRCGTWRQEAGTGLLRLPRDRRSIEYRGPYRYSGRQLGVQRVEARGTVFQELRTHWSLPLDDTEVVSDVCVASVAEGGEETLYVATTNPAGIYSMPLSASWVEYSPLYYQLDADGLRSCVKMAPLVGELCGKLVCHEEQSNRLALLDVKTSTIWKMMTESRLSSAGDRILRSVGGEQQTHWRMNTDTAAQNLLVLYELGGCRIQLLDMNSGSVSGFTSPMPISSLHAITSHSWMVEQHEGGRFLLKLADDSSELIVCPLREQGGGDDHLQSSRRSAAAVLPGPVRVCSSRDTASVLPNVIAPSRLMSAASCHAVLAVGFPQLEASDHDVYVWPRSSGAGTAPAARAGRLALTADHRLAAAVMPDSGQVVTVLPRGELPTEVRHEVAHGANIPAYLELTDLMTHTVKYLPVPSGGPRGSRAAGVSDQQLFLASYGSDCVVTVDSSATVRLWETGLALLNKSAAEWKLLTGDNDPDIQITYEQEQTGELGGPKHGREDEDNSPHVGGNTWAGGTGGRDTAGMGGLGGPYRLDAGHNVHQVSDEAKAAVPEHIKRAARQMNRKAFEERLRQIQMSEHDANMYNRISGNVSKQVRSLRVVLSGLQARDKERLWMKNQTSGELDDAKLIEGLTGERTIYKRRGDQDPELGTPQEKPKKLKLLTDVSGSMYRFNGYDGRLDRMLEAAVLVMESFEGYGDKFKYDIIGHSGEDYRVEFVNSERTPSNEKQRLQVLKMMHAHAQFCISGDSTVEATRHAIKSIAAEQCDEAFVIVLSDANLERYGISPEQFRDVLTSNSDVNTSAIFLGSLGDQAQRLRDKLPAGRSFICLDLKNLPQILQQIFTSSILQ